MKRSEVNAVIKQFEALLDQYKFRIPPYLSFTPEEWAEKGHEWDEIRDNALGWDITDYGEGDFEHKGLALITLRNGNVKDPKYTKVYAEKIMMSMPGQVSPMHFHWNKMEDIIVRGGGTAVFHLYNADPETEEKLDTPVLVCRDGRRYYVPAGEPIELNEGESLTFYPYTYHEYYIKEDSVPTLVGGCPCATTTTPTTASTHRSAASRRSKRTSRPIVCSATSIRQPRKTELPHHYCRGAAALPYLWLNSPKNKDIRNERAIQIRAHHGRIAVGHASRRQEAGRRASQLRIPCRSEWRESHRRHRRWRR